MTRATDELAPIRDLRFEGMDIPQLLEWIEQIKQGRGAGTMHTAVEALRQAVQVVIDLDNTLREQLGHLQIAWEGNAGTLAQEATEAQTAVMQQSLDPLQTSAMSVTAQGEGYDTAKGALPNKNELQHQQSENVLEWAGGGFGYESDYDAEAKQIDAQKQAAQAALGSYRDTTVTQADAYQPLPEMRPAPVHAQAVTPGSTPDVGAGGTSFSDGGATGDSSGGGTAGRDSGDAGRGGGGRGGDADRESGGRSGVGGRTDSGAHGKPGDPETPPPSEGLGLGGVLGIGAGGAAVAGLGALAAGRMLGGAKGGSGGSTGEGKAGAVGRGGSSGVGGGPGDTTAGRTASGSASSKPGTGALMGPAATRGGTASAEDDEHDNKYFVEETPFDDNRLVAPAVFGDADPDEQAPAAEDESKQA